SSSPARRWAGASTTRGPGWWRRRRRGARPGTRTRSELIGRRRWLSERPDAIRQVVPGRSGSVIAARRPAPRFGERVPGQIRGGAVGPLMSVEVTSVTAATADRLLRRRVTALGDGPSQALAPEDAAAPEQQHQQPDDRRDLLAGARIHLAADG